VLLEIARKKGNYLPELSFGTHFFQDLVEANIRYIPLYPDDPETVFAEGFFTGKPNVLIDQVYHQAFVAVDEAGTEAAAATAVIVGLKAMPAPPLDVKIDQPFIFLIRDIQTGTILFVGRVLNPAA